VSSGSRFYCHFCRLCGHRAVSLRSGGWRGHNWKRSRWDVRPDLLPDFLPAAVDQPLIGGNERHVRIDENPSVLGRDLDVEMEVRESPCLAPKEVADLADRFAFAGKTATHNPIGIELLW
jgi:hypothetical protein